MRSRRIANFATRSLARIIGISITIIIIIIIIVVVVVIIIFIIAHIYYPVPQGLRNYESGVGSIHMKRLLLVQVIRLMKEPPMAIIVIIKLVIEKSAL